MSNRFAIVILNYKTPQDTIELLNSIEQQIWADRVKVFIVDNHSEDDSIEIFNELKTSIDYEIIESCSNMGYSRGNNLGIERALSQGYKFIIVSNSDIVIYKDENFLQKIENKYLADKSVAIVAPSIINNDGIIQNPFRKNRFSKKDIIKMKLFYLTGFYKVYYVMRVYIFYSLLTMLSKNINKHKKYLSEGKIKNQSGYIYAPHGSFLIFTPSYFENFSGFDKKTFLYCEEFILAERLWNNDLKCWYENGMRVFHKESSSTNNIINSYKDKVKFSLKHTFESCKYFSRIINV
jgi:GT2 family glycosyltransferase